MGFGSQHSPSYIGPHPTKQIKVSSNKCHRHSTTVCMPIPISRKLRALKSLLQSLIRLITMAQNPQQDQEHEQTPIFDPPQPSTPISYPIKDLKTLESRSYFDSFHYPFNKASVPLPAASASELPARPRLLVCHDLQGGYGDDRWVQGGGNAGAYAIWHWHLMDVFVYFSHDLVTLPPPCWTNAAHTHGVKVLGTFITEWDAGSLTCKTLLSTKKSAQMYAERLAELAAALGFDGWLINLEVNMEPEQIINLIEFLRHLTQTVHSLVPGSLIIWYDSVTTEGKLDWQDQLNEKNKPFFDVCDGIFVNYTWKETYPDISAGIAGQRRFDVYMGIDVFGRNTYGGGQWNTNVALDLLKKDNVSAAIFAPGWVYETKQPPDFQDAQNHWWGLVENSWGILQTYPRELPFYANFDQGHGLHFSIKGLQVADTPWNNISCQSFQPVLNSFVDPIQTTMQVYTNFEDASYSGGGNITVKGSLKNDASFSIRLFHGQLALGDLSVEISYSVRSEGNSLLGLSLDFSSGSNSTTSVLLADDVHACTACRLADKYDKIFSSRARNAEEGSVDPSWILYETSLKKVGCTLTNINMACCMKGKAEDDEPAPNQPYHASLGHICIRSSEQNRGFPPADSWAASSQHVTWDSDSNGTKTVSLKITWNLKQGYTSSFTKYNIYAKEVSENINIDKSGALTSCRQFLGVARVQAYYVSDLSVSSGVTGLKFIIQACGLDGTCQELDECPMLPLEFNTPDDSVTRDIPVK